MHTLSVLIHDFFFFLHPAMRIVFIFASSFAEGLPVIGSVVPGGTIAILIGTLSSQGFLHTGTAVMIIALGSFFGDMVGFFLGKKFTHTAFIKKIVHQEKHQKNWDLFDRHIILIVIFGKLIPVIRSTPSIFAGARNVKVQKYALLSLIGSFLWGFVGIYGGNALFRLAGDWAIAIIIGFVIVTTVGTTLLSRRKKSS